MGTWGQCISHQADQAPMMHRLHLVCRQICHFVAQVVGGVGHNHSWRLLQDTRTCLTRLDRRRNHCRNCSRICSDEPRPTGLLCTSWREQQEAFPGTSLECMLCSHQPTSHPHRRYNSGHSMIDIRRHTAACSLALRKCRSDSRGRCAVLTGALRQGTCWRRISDHH